MNSDIPLRLTLITACFVIQANAATLSFVESAAVTDNFNVSVFDGKASYAGGTSSGDFGDGTVLDYRFVNNDSWVNPGDNLGTYASGSGGLISTMTAQVVSGTNGGSLNWANAWTASDPGTGFSGGDAADFTSDTLARSEDIDGTIDISGLVSGTIYFIHGSFNTNSTVNLTMTGASQPNELANRTESTSSNTAWVTSFTFSDAADYDTISFNYVNADPDASGARFMGVIIDGTAIPEPSVALLCGLGAMLFLRRRRS